MIRLGEAKPRRGRWLPLGVCVALFVTAEAGPPRRLEQITLRFSPQEATGAASPNVPRELTEHEVRLVFEDGRTVSDAAIIGEGMDDDDRRYPVRAANDVVEFAREAFETLSTSWGIRLSQDADLLLDCKLIHFFAREADQAVGSMYSADVRLTCSVTSSEGAPLFHGTASGDTRRYGKSRNENNQNEVLSDALKESIARILDKNGLKDVRAERSQAPVAPAAAMTLDGLLAELLKLQAGGLSSNLMVQYVNQQECSELMTTEHIIKWNEAGIPEEVIQAALTRWGQPPAE
jgi:hypothetical protein